MLNKLATTLSLLFMIFLAACGENTTPEAKFNTANHTPTHTTTIENPSQNDTDNQQAPNKSDFKAKLAFDVNAIKDQLAEDEYPILEILEKNLLGLVNHNYEDFKSGFVEGKLAEILGFYYGENLLYQFTGIEEITHHSTPKNQLHIFVLGQCLDTNTGSIEDVKLMYAIGKNDQGAWVIHTID